MKTQFISLLILPLLWNSHSVIAAEDASDALPKALFEEEANRNLDAAIKGYQNVVAQFDGQRKLAATAIFRIGECYRKLGKTNDAVAQYERIVREFTDQPTLAKLSEQNLFALGVNRNPTARAGTAMESSELRSLEATFAEESTGLENTKAGLELLQRSIRRGDFDRIEVDAPDELLTELLKTHAAQEQKFAGLIQRFTAEHPDVIGARAVLVKISEQISARLFSLELVMKQRESLQEKNVGVLRQKIENLKARPLVVTGKTEVSTIETGANAPPTNAEAEEVRRIQALIKDSPDLINAMTTVITVSGQADSMGTPLHKAAVDGQLVVAEFLLSHGADSEAKLRLGKTALHLAAQNGHKSMVELLLSKGANVQAADDYGHTPLHLAAGKGYRAVVEILLANKAQLNAADKNGHTPLHKAVTAEFKAVAELLLAHGADVNAQGEPLYANPSGENLRPPVAGTPLHFAAWNASLTTLLLAHKADPNARNAKGYTPIFYAGNETIPLLIKSGADVNALAKDPNHSNWTPLHFAVALNQNALVDWLLTNRADPNLSIIQYGTAACENWSPLLMAAGNGRADIAASLLKYKADPNFTNGCGISPLLRATFDNKPELVELFLKHQADTEASYYDNQQTALLAAAANGFNEIAELLLKHDANPNARDKQGRTALHFATDRRSNRIVELLIAHKADVNAQDNSGKAPLDMIGSGGSQFGGLQTPPPPPTAPGIPARVFRNGGVTVSAEPPADIATLLRKAGANEDLRRLSIISLGRKAGGLSTPLFFKGTNSFNRYSLLEAIANQYRDPRGRDVGGFRGSGSKSDLYSFPDFANVTIQRLGAKGGQPVGIRVDLEAIFATGDCAKNPWLEWGDTIEIPELDHKVSEGWRGLSREAIDMMRRCLERKVKIVIKGETTTATLRPDFFTSQMPNGFEQERKISEGIVLTDFRLKQVVERCGLLRASSDASRVKLKRAKPETGPPLELLFNLGAVQSGDSNTDLWLRDGDVIEVPDK